jgi:hypothetical protein
LKLFNYFQKLKNVDDFFEIDQYVVYNKIVTQDEALKIIKKYSKKLRLLNFYELDLYIEYRNNKIKNVLQRNFNLNPLTENYIFIGKKENKISRVKGFKINNNQISESSLSQDSSGILIFKRIINKKHKDYKNIEDIIKDPNVGLYVYSDSVKKHIIGYNIELYENFKNQNAEFKNPILFSGIISNNDRINQEAPYSGSIIFNTVTRMDVSGRNILYPILTFLSNNKIIMPDRDSLSDSAQSVWDKFFFKNFMLIPYKPIDDIEKPITDVTLDDGKIYMSPDEILKSKQYDIQKIISPQEQEIKLKEIRQNDPYNWTYILKSEFKGSVENCISELIYRHKFFLENINSKNDFLNDLRKISVKLFKKRV